MKDKASKLKLIVSEYDHMKSIKCEYHLESLQQEYADRGFDNALDLAQQALDDGVEVTYDPRDLAKFLLDKKEITPEKFNEQLAIFKEVCEIPEEFTLDSLTKMSHDNIKLTEAELKILTSKPKLVHIYLKAIFVIEKIAEDLSAASVRVKELLPIDSLWHAKNMLRYRIVLAYEHLGCLRNAFDNARDTEHDIEVSCCERIIDKVIQLHTHSAFCMPQPVPCLPGKFSDCSRYSEHPEVCVSNVRYCYCSHTGSKRGPLISAITEHIEYFATWSLHETSEMTEKGHSKDEINKYIEVHRKNFTPKITQICEDLTQKISNALEHPAGPAQKESLESALQYVSEKKRACIDGTLFYDIASKEPDELPVPEREILMHEWVFATAFIRYRREK